MRRFIRFLSIGFILLIITACNNQGEEEVTIGYFPNLTHIASIVALENGYFQEQFGEDTKIETKVVSNGGLFMESLVTGAIDVGTVGPSPAIHTYVQSPRHRIISGAVNGGAVLVANSKSEIEKVEDLAEKNVAIPVIGSTQDIMLRKALKDVDLAVDENGGNVSLHPQAPADTVSLFTQDEVDAAATQEPWGYVLQNQADGKVVLDWKDFAWGKESTNTVVVANDTFLEDNENAIAYLTAHKQAVEYIKENPEKAKELVIQHIKKLTSKELDEKEVEVAFEHLEVTTNVNEDVLKEMASISLEADYIEDDNISGLVELKYLHAIDE